jgi:hypothetical protein
VKVKILRSGRPFCGAFGLQSCSCIEASAAAEASGPAAGAVTSALDATFVLGAGSLCATCGDALNHEYAVLPATTITPGQLTRFSTDRAPSASSYRSPEV